MGRADCRAAAAPFQCPAAHSLRRAEAARPMQGHGPGAGRAHQLGRSLVGDQAAHVVQGCLRLHRVPQPV